MQLNRPKSRNNSSRAGSRTSIAGATDAHARHRGYRVYRRNLPHTRHVPTRLQGDEKMLEFPQNTFGLALTPRE